MEKLLLYCTLGKPNLYLPPEHNCFEGDEASKCYLKDEPILEGFDIKLNGKIAVECDCELVEKIFSDYFDNGVETNAYYYTNGDTDIEESACLDTNDLALYLGQKIGGEKVGYAIHLKNVKVFDEPEELSKYGLKKAPQNMCYVYDKDGNKYLLLSIHPKHLCNIINGDKTIEVRRKILKDLEELIR